MAPEAEDTSNPKTNKVDIWSLGCILYQMMAGSLLFHSRREVWRHADSASSLPSVVKNKGLSVACEKFLGDVLQPSPDDRPSAEVCLTKPWIKNKASGSEYYIGSDLYNKLYNIERAAPSLEPLPDAAVNLAVGVYGASSRKLNYKIGSGALSPAPEEAGVYCAPREPPAWKLDYKIGSGAFGTVFLEKVQTYGMVPPELWAVKRIPKDVPNFSVGRSRVEVKNLQALSKVSFIHPCLVS